MDETVVSFYHQVKESPYLKGTGGVAALFFFCLCFGEN